jgi:hypothetical protein
VGKRGCGLMWNLPGQNEKNHENHSEDSRSSGQRFELSIPFKLDDWLQQRIFASILTPICVNLLWQSAYVMKALHCHIKCRFQNTFNLPHNATYALNVIHIWSSDDAHMTMNHGNEITWMSVNGNFKHWMTISAVLREQTELMTR